MCTLFKYLQCQLLCECLFVCATWVFTKMVPSQIIQSSWPTILVLNQLGFRGPILTPKNECHFVDPCRKTWIHLTFS